MIDIDELEKLCKYEINRGTANPYTVNENPIHAMQELITRLRQAEKDAARYRWLRDDASGLEMRAPLVFNADEYGTSSTVIDGEHLDVAIDEAMKCK